MKVGILTFHRASNYGAVLQTYALNKFLNNNNVNSEIVDYRDNRVDNEYKLFRRGSSLKRKIRDIIYYPIQNKKNNKFEEFRKKHILISEKVYTKSNIKEANKTYDYFITGSDQVFNYKLTDFDKNYFLSFVDDSTKKISYAASLGMDKIPSDKIEEYSNLLKDFYKISLREKQNKQMIEDLINREISINIDPTFLISKEEWLDIAEVPKEKDYILVFVMQRNKSMFSFAEKLAKEKKCKIIYIPNDYKRIVKGKYKYNISPSQWLGYFKNAKYVITNSFHGLAFSIILNKDFYIELQKEPAKANARMIDLLKEFNLEDRIVDKEVYKEIPIDWSIINKKKLDLIINTKKYFEFLEEVRK